MNWTRTTDSCLESNAIERDENQQRMCSCELGWKEESKQDVTEWEMILDVVRRDGMKRGWWRKLKDSWWGEVSLSWTCDDMGWDGRTWKMRWHIWDASWCDEKRGCNERNLRWLWHTIHAWWRIETWWDRTEFRRMRWDETRRDKMVFLS